MSEDKILHPEKNDVLCGRGKFAMNWPGNLFYKYLIEYHRCNYFSGDNNAKRQVTVDIVNEISSRSPPGRFLKIINDEWVEAGNEIAVQKTRQALREGKFINILNITNFNKRNKSENNKQAIQKSYKSLEKSNKSKVESQHKEFVSSCETPKSALSHLNSTECNGEKLYLRIT